MDNPNQKLLQKNHTPNPPSPIFAISKTFIRQICIIAGKIYNTFNTTKSLFRRYLDTQNPIYNPKTKILLKKIHNSNQENAYPLYPKSYIGTPEIIHATNPTQTQKQPRKSNKMTRSVRYNILYNLLLGNL